MKTLGSDDYLNISIAEAEAACVPITQKGVANGVASLDSSAKIPIAQIPSGVGDWTSWIRVFGDGSGDYTTLSAALAANTGAGARFVVSGEVTEPANSRMLVHSDQLVKFTRGVVWLWGENCIFATRTLDTSYFASNVTIESEGPVDCRVLSGQRVSTGEWDGVAYARFCIWGSGNDLSKACFKVTSRSQPTFSYTVMPTVECIAFIAATRTDLGRWIIDHKINYTSMNHDGNTVVAAVFTWWNSMNRNTLDVDIRAWGSTVNAGVAPGFISGVHNYGGLIYGNVVTGKFDSIWWGTTKGRALFHSDNGTFGGNIFAFTYNTNGCSAPYIPAGNKDLTISYTA